MKIYNRILVAVDLAHSSTEVLQRALEISHSHESCQIFVIHIVEYMPFVGIGEAKLIDPAFGVSRDELVGNAFSVLGGLLEQFGPTEITGIVEVGSPSSEIIHCAKDNDVNLIVVGSHGRHGVKLLLGSTANAVLHHASCDVLAVRVQD